MKYTQKNQYLVFSSIDTKRAGYSTWLESDERDFDVVLYVYNGTLKDKRVDYSVEKKGYKFQNFFDFALTHDVFCYDAVWIVDDDIEISTKNINKLFETFIENDLWLAQPSYDIKSFSAWDLLFNDDNYILRYTNFVEVGVPLISRVALKVILPVMKDIISGWGADFVWPTILGFPINKIAVIDQIQCHHPKHESSINITIPRHWHSKDGEILMKHYNAKYYTPRVLSGIPS